ncbi:hypothetical protein [Pseudomonas hunanensis]|nr:hypothetical protein [Pseudomonas hunanensis]
MLISSAAFAEGGSDRALERDRVPGSGVTHHGSGH